MREADINKIIESKIYKYTELHNESNIQAVSSALPRIDEHRLSLAVVLQQEPSRASQVYDHAGIFSSLALFPIASSQEK